MLSRLGDRAFRCEADDLSYERGALKRAERVGVKVNVHELARDLSQEDLEQVILDINADDSVYGCLVFRPLPQQIDEEKIGAMLASKKTSTVLLTVL